MLQKVRVGDLSIAYQRTGSGPAMVLLHGFILDSRSWRPQLEQLSDCFTVLAWDAPGAGLSDDPPDAFGMSDWADALAGVIAAAGISQAHIVGLSWGGLLAQEFYARHASCVRSLVLAGTYAGWAGSLSAPMTSERLAAAVKDSLLPSGAFVQKYLPGMFSDVPLPAIRDELGRIMADFHPAGFRSMATAIAQANTRQLLSSIDVPTLLIWGDADKRSPLPVGEAMREMIPGARLEILKGAGHLANLERPIEFTALVRDFCRAVK